MRAIAAENLMKRGFILVPGRLNQSTCALLRCPKSALIALRLGTGHRKRCGQQSCCCGDFERKAHKHELVEFSAMPVSPTHCSVRAAVHRTGRAAHMPVVSRARVRVVVEMFPA